MYINCNTLQRKATIKKVAKTKGEANPCLRMLRDMKTQMSKTLTRNKPTMTQERECNNSEMLLRNWKYFDERCNFGLNHAHVRKVVAMAISNNPERQLKISAGNK